MLTQGGQLPRARQRTKPQLETVRNKKFFTMQLREELCHRDLVAHQAWPYLGLREVGEKWNRVIHVNGF